MKRTLKVAVVFLSAVLAVNLVAVLPANKVNADARKYNHKYGSTYYGEYDLYDNETDAVSKIKSELISRNSEITFYYVKNNSSNKSKMWQDLVNKALVHDQSNPVAGDYLAKSFESYTYSYIFFEKGYNSNDLYKVTYKFSFYTNGSQENNLKASLSSLNNKILNSGMDAYEKISSIYSWITTNVKYDYTNAKKAKSLRDTITYTAYSAFYNKTAVCQGIAGLFYDMLLEAGIDNRIVYSNNHCWNIVNVDGIYYNCDATWDLGTNGNYQYFMCGNTSSFKNDHSIGSDSIYLGYNVSSVDYVKEDGLSGTEAFVSRLYTVVLGREAESEGLKYWSDLLNSKKTDGATTAKNFFDSAEFSSKSLSNEEYLAILYKTFFNREMDEGGRDYWLGELSSGTSSNTVLGGFINSNEWKEVCNSYGIAPGSVVISGSSNTNDEISGFASRLYTTILCRDAEESGLEYWSSELRAKRVTGTTAAYNFVFSQEFLDANVSNSEFVKRLYRLFMDREYDEGGLNYWVGLLEAGESRESVFYGFSGSEEFGKVCESYGISR
ncbi:MAG: DUF4214 domain-containing protein [Clostridiales bacterium]|nr:DUF4214 domain-containing protein [Clostridiales bacterium]